MNLYRKPVTLTPNMVRVARQVGEAKANWYASPEGMMSASRSRSGQWGAETDPVRQGQGVAGEYAVAVFYGLNPRTAVSRSIGTADDGGDVTITATMRVDVKTTPDRKRWLLWPLSIIDLYWSKRFDALVSVSINEDDWSQCWIEGCSSKADFFERKLIADGVNDQGKLTPGTWFMEKTALHPIDTLLAGFVGFDADGHFVHYCHCGKFGPFGFGHFPRKGELGTWYCKEHKPS
jgi:hypothetical protein